MPSRDAAGRSLPGILIALFLLLLWVLSLAFSVSAGFGSPAARAAFENVSVMQQSIQHGGDGGTIAEQLSPVFHWSIGGDQRAGTLVATHDDLQQFLGGDQGQLAHSKVVDDEQRHGGEQFHMLLAVAVKRGVCQFFQQDVRFAIHHAIALLDDSVSDGLGKWLFPLPAGPRKSASSRRPIHAAVARSKTRLRFIFGLNWKSKLSSSLFASRNCACLWRRSSSRLLRQASSSETSMEIRSMGAMASD